MIAKNDNFIVADSSVEMVRSVLDKDIYDIKIIDHNRESFVYIHKKTDKQHRYMIVNTQNKEVEPEIVFRQHGIHHIYDARKDEVIYASELSDKGGTRIKIKLRAYGVSFVVFEDETE